MSLSRRLSAGMSPPHQIYHPPQDLTGGRRRGAGGLPAAELPYSKKAKGGGEGTY